MTLIIISTTERTILITLLLLTFSWTQWHRIAIAAFAASPNIPPPPSLSLPVWSLACPLTSSIREAFPNLAESQSTSMNIVTYAMPVNVAPPKLYAISLYKSTLTRAAFLESKVGILQLLSPLQSKLVPILGKRSGLEEGFNKKLACTNLDSRWRSFSTCCDSLESISRSSSTVDTIISVNATEVLPHCQAYIFLELRNTVDAGDHDVTICQVIATGQWKSDRLVLLGNDDTAATPKDATSVLYSGQLRLEGII